MFLLNGGILFDKKSQCVTVCENILDESICSYCVDYHIYSHQ